ASGSLSDESGRQARHGARFGRQTPLTNNRARQTKIEYRREVQIASDGFQFGCNDAGTHPQLGHPGARQLGHGWHDADDVLQPVNTATFVIDGEQWRNRRDVPQPCRQVIHLIETFDIALMQEKAGGLYGFQQNTSLRVGFTTLKAENKQLSDFLLEREMRIP